MPPSSRHEPPREIIYEFIPVGNVVRVSAMDTRTLTEVVISAPRNYSKETMQNRAKAKLYYVLRKNGHIQ